LPQVQTSPPCASSDAPNEWCHVARLNEFLRRRWLFGRCAVHCYQITQRHIGELDRLEGFLHKLGGHRKFPFVNQEGAKLSIECLLKQFDDVITGKLYFHPVVPSELKLLKPSNRNTASIVFVPRRGVPPYRTLFIILYGQ